MRIEVVGNQIVSEIGGAKLAMPVSGDATKILPHIVRPYLESDELRFFNEAVEAFGGCAGVIVREVNS